LYCQVVLISVIFYQKYKKKYKKSLLNVGIRSTQHAALWLPYIIP